MTYSRRNPVRHLSTITPYSRESIGRFISPSAPGIPSAGAWPSANLGTYVPFFLDVTSIAVKMFWVNGATLTSDVDVAIYSAAAGRLVSIGPTTQSGASTIQVVDITDTELAPGNYFMALSCSTNTGTFFRNTPAILLQQSWGVHQQASVGTLPSTATFAAPSQTTLPVFGLSFVTTV